MSSSGFLIGPRFGLDVGGEHVRIRFALDAFRYRHEVRDGTSWDPSTGMMLALAVRM